jgi:hypothetical protein
VFGLFSAGTFITALPAQAIDLMTWESVGDVQYFNDQITLTNAVSDGSDDTSGKFNLSGNNPVFIDSLESFLNVSVGTFDFDLIEGSAIRQQSLVVGAGDVLKFDWNFLTNEDPTSSSPNSDYAFVIINDQPTQLASITSSLIPSTSFSYETGFNTYSYKFEVAGTYSVSVVLIDGVDIKSSSSLILKKTSVTPSPSPTPSPNPTPSPSPTPPSKIPEPGSIIGLLVVAGAGRWLKRTKHNHTNA